MNRGQTGGRAQSAKGTGKDRVDALAKKLTEREYPAGGEKERFFGLPRQEKVPRLLRRRRVADTEVGKEGNNDVRSSHPILSDESPCCRSEGRFPAGPGVFDLLRVCSNDRVAQKKPQRPRWNGA